MPLSGELLAGLVLAFVSAIVINLAYLREHAAASSMPALSVRHPLHSAGLLLGDRKWLLAFGMESGGFLLYVAALALAPLSLVQSISAGGIGVLAFASARMARRRLTRVELAGVLLSVLGLAALAVSLVGGKAQEGGGELGPILLWLGVTAAIAIALVVVGRRHWGAAVANGIAGGLFFSIGDISTKLTTQGGARAGFVVLLLIGYGAGTALLQIGYQAGAALTVAGTGDARHERAPDRRRHGGARRAAAGRRARGASPARVRRRGHGSRPARAAAAENERRTGVGAR